MAVVDWQAGTFSGKVGGIVGANWKGINLVRSVPQRKKPDTEKQALHKIKYKAAYKLITPVYDTWIKKHYNPSNMTPANYIIKNINPVYWSKTPIDYYAMKYPNTNSGIVITADRTYKTGENNRGIENFTLTGATESEVTRTLFIVVYPNDDYYTDVRLFNGLPEFPILFNNHNSGNTFYIMQIECGNRVSNCLNVYDFAKLPQPTA